MKKVILFLLLLVNSAPIFGQKYYTDKKEYESALKYYNDAKDSYENYLKKIEYFKNYKYPKRKVYSDDPDSWNSSWKSDLEILNIRQDNNSVRLHPNIIPEDTLYINFIEIPDSVFLLIKITTQRMSEYDYKFCARTLKFKHPGKPPVFVERVTPKPNKKERVKIKEDKKVDIVLEISKPIQHRVMDIYFMPDGKKYTYDSLIKSYPAMSDNKVFLSYFKN